MPLTDHMALAEPEIKKQFDDLFAFAKKEGAVEEGNRAHYSQRFAGNPFDTRREIDMLIAGAKYRDLGLDAVHIVVRDLPGYPGIEKAGDTDYPESWI